MLANRIVWSLVLLLVVLTLLKRWAWLGPALRSAKTVLAFVATSALLAGNWLTYIYAVTHGHVVEASLGYFMVPLVSVALGTMVLGERPRKLQWVAVGLAAVGVVVMTASAGTLPWIGLVLAFTFGFYGLVRKVAPLGPLEGMMLEVLLMLPLAVAMMAWAWGSGPASFPAPTLGANLWLLGLGPATAAPLLLFAYGARNLPMTTLGLLQYLSPTIAFLLGLAFFGEALTAGRLAGFAFIWSALALYSADAWRGGRPAPVPVRAV